MFASVTPELLSTQREGGEHVRDERERIVTPLRSHRKHKEVVSQVSILVSFKRFERSTKYGGDDNEKGMVESAQGAVEKERQGQAEVVAWQDLY